jgi:hypothetical protein
VEDDGSKSERHGVREAFQQIEATDGGPDVTLQVVYNSRLSTLEVPPLPTLACSLLFASLLSAETDTKPMTSTVPDAVVLKALCPKHRSCRVLEKVAAGRDARGNERTFAGVQEQPPTGAKQQVAEGEDTEDGPCLRAPYAILHTTGDRVVSLEPIMTLREDSQCSYGARGGDESLAFDGKTVTFSMEGGSAWAWSEQRTWEIDPRLRLIKSASHGWWTLGSNVSSTTVDHRTGRVRQDFNVPDCGPDGAPPDSEDVGGAGKYVYTEIPQLAADDAFAAQWATAAFPKAALLVTSTGGDGYLVFGKAGGARDARFRVLALSGRVLVVEVADAKLSTGGKSWVSDDHLEVWAGGELPSYYTHCVQRGPAGQVNAEGKVVAAQQWGIRTSDATISRGWGNPDVDPQVERMELASSDWGKVIRFRITFARDLASVTVAYSDSDNGKRQKRLTATSRIMLKDPLSLGTLGEAPAAAGKPLKR